MVNTRRPVVVRGWGLKAEIVRAVNTGDPISDWICYGFNSRDSITRQIFIGRWPDLWSQVTTVGNFADQPILSWGVMSSVARRREIWGG